jgi:phosphate transport system substrate-binding protein
MISLLLLSIAACASGNASPNKIAVVSREDGSGTRGAFVELCDIEQKNESGEKIDHTIDSAEITNSTAVMMTTVAGDPAAIGYISLGSLNDTVKAVSIDGVAPSTETIKDGSYPIARPFNIATKGELSPVASDFISFILSTEGQAVVEKKGYISLDNTQAYQGVKPAGKVVVAGSSSVTPVMEALKEAYLELNPSAQIEVQQSDSTTGMNSAKEGICDIGMASRGLKDSEIEAGLVPTVIAQDGIAVVVNTENTISNLTKEQVQQIYTGSITDWSELS